MGQKTHPVGFRLGFNKNWISNWYDERHFADKLNEDIMLRKYIHARMEHAAVSQVEIMRTTKRITITIHTARPGIVIGKKGEEVDHLREEIRRLTEMDIQINVKEIKRPELSAPLVGRNIADQLVRKISFRRAVKKAIQSTMRMGADGIKVTVSGRLGGADMSRTETFHQGRVPLHTLRSDIDYALSEARTTYGVIGVKVWICNGEAVGVPG